ncbi:MAG: hypothetical protein ABH842_02480 [Candidatus Micrarchaeota archaeon]
MRTTRTSGPKTPESKKMGWKNYAAIGTTTAAVAAMLLFKTCSGGPQTEGPILPPEPSKPVAAATMHEEPKECVQVTRVVRNVQEVTQIEWVEVEAPRTDCVPCDLPPVKGDGIVELSKGEGESRSPRHDPADAGRCGDGVAGPLEIPNADAPVRSKQDGEPTFTPEDAKPVVCLADTHCGDGILQRNVVVGVEVPVVREDGTTVYEFATVKINEVCDPGIDPRCKDDCSGRKPSPVRAAARVKIVPECTDDVNASIYQRVKQSVLSHIKRIRGTVGAEDRDFTVSVTIDVDSSGMPVVRNGGVSCGRDGCASPGNESQVLSLATSKLVRLDSGECKGVAHTVVVGPEQRQ